MMSPTPLRLLAVLAFGVSLLSGCTPAPESTPTPSPAFTSDEEAFAAAEATYREFTRRLNEVDTSDPATFEPLYELSTGDFEKADRKAYSAMHAEGVKVEGETRILSFAAVESDATHKAVAAVVCLDVSDVEVTDSNGVSQVAPGRPDVYALRVNFVNERGTYVISSAQGESETEC
ncbi:hypothetical protein [Microbacterium sp. KSW4-4]|uniref:hypothetical protein n=1 Tax=Microbacterium sp. KSW4-4 TaxID=2851651 RepID=UPI001FFD57B9|nr:hypothetical protein [Microbacterium sp. KSW4-4]MCK2032042.1 hypothetical protein [Microbacterium sp. KSW4-4]